MVSVMLDKRKDLFLPFGAVGTRCRGTEGNTREGKKSICAVFSIMYKLLSVGLEIL